MITPQRSGLKLRLARGVRYALVLHSAGKARNPKGGQGSCRAAESMRVPASRLGGILALPWKILAAREETKR